MKFYSLVFIFSVTSALAQGPALTSYIKVQEALAADDFKSALERHKAMCTKELQHIKAEYTDCTKSFKTIDELRTSFKKLSEVYFKKADQKELNNFQKATCPMAEARWIQKKGDLRNPYYGKSMLECGEKI
jgi:hypothetical protein